MPSTPLSYSNTSTTIWNTQTLRKVNCREIQWNQTQIYKKESIVLLENKLQKTYIYIYIYIYIQWVDEFSQNLGLIPKF
jgi:hypothetical protein